MEETKKIGNFLYKYFPDGTVVVAKTICFAPLDSQIGALDKMSGISRTTGFFCNLECDGRVYKGVGFEHVEEEYLIEALIR